MGYYDRHILPRLIDLACSVRPVQRQREKIVPRAHGQVWRPCTCPAPGP